jgi:hypothetical protein
MKTVALERERERARERDMSQYHFVNHKSHMNCLDFELVRVRFVVDKVALGRK